jgi:hypothetical protein
MTALLRREVVAGAVAVSAGAAAPAPADPCRIVELRQYLMRPGRRQDLAELFDREFVETQEAVGITVIGQYLDLDRPDRYVWMRGFPDMDARARSLEAFYGGPVWKAHREAANATMIDSDDVLLLHPVGLAFRPSRTRAGLGSPPPAGLVVAEIYYPKPGAEAAFAELFARTVAPAMAAGGAELIGTFATEHSPNSFPRLPVREGEPAYVALSRFAGPLSHDRYRLKLATRAWRDGPAAEMAALTDRRAEMLRLAPTPRSALR